MNARAYGVLSLVLAATLFLAPCSLGASITRMSVPMAGGEANGESGCPVITPDGRYVVFQSWATNLIPGLAPYARHVYVFDREDGELECASIASDGTPAHAPNGSPAVSSDGRYVAFDSAAPDLAGEEPWDNDDDVFVHDRQTGSTVCLTIPWVSADVSAEAVRPVMSGDGRYVAFVATATDGSHYVRSVFLHDAVTGAMTNIVRAQDGGWPDGDSSDPQISRDGRFIVFVSTATNLAPGGTLPWERLFLYEVRTGRISRIATAWDGGEPNAPVVSPGISRDGRFVSFTTGATNIIQDAVPGGQAYRLDRSTGETVLVSGGADPGAAPLGADRCWISPDGGYVVFASTGLVPEPGAFRHLLVRKVGGPLAVVDATADGALGNGDGSDPLVTGVSTGARYIAFVSFASNLVAGDSNGWADVFLWQAPPMHFADVAEGSWASAAITACAAADIVSGYPDGTYHPTETVTRAQMAVYLARALAGGEIDAPSGLDSPLFTDVLPTHWAYRYIQYIALRSIVQGYASSYYLPDQPVDRAQMAAFLARAVVGGESGVPFPSGPPTFSDVGDSSWAYRYVEYVAAQGIAQGYPGGLYHPEYPVTRDQMAVYLQRAFDLPM